MDFLGRCIIGAGNQIPASLGKRLSCADFNSIASIGAIGFGLSQLLFAYNVIQCVRKKGSTATAEVWDHPQGLEWTVPSPAPYHTFETPPTSSVNTSFS